MRPPPAARARRLLRPVHPVPWSPPWSPLWSPLLALGGAVLACSGAPSPSPRAAAKPAELPPPAAPAAPQLPARWVDSSGATLVGPAVPGGTLVLLGGRRVVVGPDGAARPEAAPAPEALREIVEVPAAAAGQAAAPAGPTSPTSPTSPAPKTGARRLVARGEHGIYRLDDPLGAPALIARSELPILHIGAAPGLVAVWDSSSDLPRFVDVETGAQRQMPSLPPPPLDAIAFVDARRGAAIFEAAGLAVTTDGGATFRLVRDATPGDALRVRGLRLRGEQIRAYVHADGRDAPVDLAGARLGPMDDGPPPPAAEPPLLRWVRLTGRDPLEAALSSGALAGDGVALAASHGLLARVDLQRGLVLDLVAFAEGTGGSACGVGGTARVAWVACALGEDQKQDLYDPFGVLRVPLGPGRLAADKPALTRNGEAELRASPSGGVMLLAPCNADEEGAACVRQPSGRWVTVKADVDLTDRGAGPLADGRVALLRGLWDGDAPQGVEAANPAPGQPRRGGDSDDAPARGPYVALLGLDGKERPAMPLGPLGGPSAAPPAGAPAAPDDAGDLRVVSPIEEAEDHALSLVLSSTSASGEELWAVVLPPGRDAPTLTRLPGVTHARVHEGHGVAVGEEQVLASRDAGATWSPVPAPERVRAAVQRVDLFDEPGVLTASAVGLKIDTQLRLGWGPPAPEPRAPEVSPTPGASLPRRPPPPASGPDLALACASQGPAASAPPLLGSNQVTALLAKGAKPAPAGSEIRTSTATAGRWGMLDAVAQLEEQGPKTPGSPPATWTLRWFDPAELGGKPRAWTGPPPKGVTMGATLRAVSAQGSRALFTLRAGGKHLLARAKAPGSIELAEVPWELLPGTEVVFGTDRGEPIAWLHDTALVVWVSGEQPRIVANIATHATRTLGQPTRDGVPLLLSANDWALWRRMPLGPARAGAGGAGGAGAASGAPPAPAAAIPLDGWSAAPNVRRELGRLPACGPQPRGERFLIQRLSGAATVDGHRESVQGAVYDVRVTGNEACVAQVAALLAPEGAAAKTAPAPGAPANKPAPPASGPVAFARVDLLAKRAEGGERGVGGAVRRLACGLEARK